MFEESVHEESAYEETTFDESAQAEAAAEVIRSWAVPAGARRAQVIRAALIGALGYKDVGSELIADLAVGPLVEALAQMEVELADARRRIDELERASSAARRAGG